MHPFSTHWKHHESYGYLFLGGRERVHLEQMGYGRTKWNEYKKK